MEQNTNIEDKIKNLPIGFFDSGVGGLSVYSKFRKQLPFENTLYFGDLKNMPYGSKSKEDLLMYARTILDFFKSKNVKSVVIACNTSSAVVYDTVKDEYDFKLYPIIQSCAKVISSMNYNSVGVFATSATVNAGVYKKELQKYNPNIRVYEMACPNWTSYIENGEIDTDKCRDDVREKVRNMMKHNPDKIILGCTHYPYLLKTLSEFESRYTFIDPAGIFVEYIKNDLKKTGLLNPETKEGTEEFYVSANPKEFVENAKLFYEVKHLPPVI